MVFSFSYILNMLAGFFRPCQISLNQNQILFLKSLDSRQDLSFKELK